MSDYFDWIEQEAENARMNEEIEGRARVSERMTRDEENAQMFLEEVTKECEEKLGKDIGKQFHAVMALRLAQRLAIATRMMGEEVQKRKEAEYRIRIQAAEITKLEADNVRLGEECEGLHFKAREYDKYVANRSP